MKTNAKRKTNARRRTPPKRKTPPISAVYISAPQVCDRYGGRSHMWLERKLQTDPNFPRPKYFGRLRFFTISELEDYERNCAAPEIAREPTEQAAR